MALASSLPPQERRVLACFAASLAAHALLLFARVPPPEIPMTVLPPMEVRVVELPPPPKPAAEPPRPLPQAVPAPPPPPILAAEKPSEVAAAPREPETPPAISFDPPMSAQEKARLDPRYLAAAAVDRAASTLDDRREPEYPRDAMEKGITGCVLVVVYVGASGNVENIEVLRSDPPKIFDRAAMRAFVGGRYLPAIKDNAPVAARIAGVASFELEGKPSPMCAMRYFPLVRELDGKPLGARFDAAR